MGNHFVLLVATLVLSGSLHAQDWQRIGPDGGMPNALEVPDPTGDRAYAVGGGGLFRSDDRGATWSLMPSPDENQGSQSFSLRAFSKDNPDAVVLGRRDALWRSTDGGQSWRELAIGIPENAELDRITAIAVDPNDAQRIAVFMVAMHWFGKKAVPFSALWMTEDGEHPTLLERTVNRDPECSHIVSSPLDHVNAAVFLDGDLYYHHYYRCQAAGSSHVFPVEEHIHRWDHPLNVQRPLSSAVTAWATMRGHMVAATGKIYLSTNWGSIRRLDLVTGTAVEVRGPAAQLQAFDDGSLVSGETGGLFRSTDQGASWQPIDNDSLGLAGTAAPSRILAAAFSAPTRWLAGCSEGIFRSDDLGTLWQPSFNGFTSFQVRALDIDQSDERRIWAGTGRFSGSVVAQLPKGRVLLRTTDGGSTWTDSDLPSIGLSLHNIVVDQASTSDHAQTILYANGIGCYSTDACPPGVNHLPGLFKSTNAGTNWQPIGGSLAFPHGHEIRSISMGGMHAPADRHLAVTGHHVLTGLALRSNNAGATWAGQTSGLPAPGEENAYSDAMDINIAPSNSQRVYLSTYSYPGSSVSQHVHRNGVFRSDDGGATWTHRSAGLPVRPDSTAHTGAYRLVVHPSNADLAWVITLDEDEAWPHDARHRVYRTQNGGINWTEASAGLTPGNFTDIALDPARPNHLYLATFSGVFHTSDGGVSWHRLGSPQVGTSLSLAIGPNHVFAGTYLGVVKIPKPQPGDPIFSHDFEPASGNGTTLTAHRYDQ